MTAGRSAPSTPKSGAVARRAARPIFARPDGEPIAVGSIQWQPMKLNVNGVRLFSKFLSTDYPARNMVGGLDTVGAEMVEGAFARDDWGPLLELLSYAGTPRLIQSNLEHDSVEPDQIAALVTHFFDQTGLRYMDHMVKNSASVIMAETDALLRASAPALATAVTMETVLEHFATNGMLPVNPLTGTATGQASSTA